LDPEGASPSFHWEEREQDALDPRPGHVRSPGEEASERDLYEPDWRDRVRALFSEEEWHCVTHKGSAVTRLSARAALAEALGLSEDRLEIRCSDGVPGRRVPLPFLDGEPLAVDLSLSHHGRFSAWTFNDQRTDSAGRTR
jgi:hypothetical protein